MYKQVVVIFDESPQAERALKAAISLAGDLGSDLHLLTVVHPPPAYTAYAVAAGPEATRAIEQDHVAFYAEIEAKACRLAEAAELSMTRHQVLGVDVNLIIDRLRGENADLVVIGLHRTGWVVSRLWNKVFELAQDSPCSILGVH